MSVGLRNLKGVRKGGKEGRGERAARVDHALDTSSAGCGRFLFVTVIAGEIESSLSRGEVGLLVVVYGRLLNASWPRWGGVEEHSRGWSHSRVMLIFTV